MKYLKKTLSIIVMSILCFSLIQVPAVRKYTPIETPTVYAAKNMRLSVKGTSLVNSKGKKVQLRGVSTHGLAWYPQYVDKKGFKRLRDDWKVNTIRMAMYTEEYGGYLSGGNQAELEKLIDNGVKYTKSLGMYCIIDWHILNDGNPLTHKKEAKKFFKKMSKKYKNYDNVIYEICNEPNNCSWDDVRKYANSVIPVIRKNDKKAIILVGTPTWSQDVDLVAASPVKNQKNVMYTCHFYAATHGDWNRKKVKTALDAKTPIFVSEFSICDASGGGNIDKASAKKWKKLINKYNLSYCGWSLSNKAETSALIKSSCNKTSGWKTKDLTATGKWLRKMTRGE